MNPTKIRAAELSDIDAIAELRTDPRVLSHQYQLSDPRGMYSEIVNDRRYQECDDVRLDAIVYGEMVVGYIMHSHADFDEIRASQCAWSVHPDFWGRGIMTFALRSLLDRLILEWDRTHVIATCFASNERCIRLLKRLRFVRWQYSLGERISTMYRYQSLKWEHRYGLTAEMWNDASA